MSVSVYLCICLSSVFRIVNKTSTEASLVPVIDKLLNKQLVRCAGIVQCTDAAETAVQLFQANCVLSGPQNVHDSPDLLIDWLSWFKLGKYS